MQLSYAARVHLAPVITDLLIAVRERCRNDGMPVPGWAAELAELRDSLLRCNATGVTREDRVRALTRERVRRHRARRRAAGVLRACCF